NYYYSPFGELWQGERESDTNPFRYAGEYLDKETGNIYLRARYYDPSIGRFISVDPIKDGTNWYVYCSNNPIAFVDPSGLVVTQWDHEHCSYDEIKQLEENTKLWENGSAETRKKAAESSKSIRKKYLSIGDTLLDNGCVETIYTDTLPVKVCDGAVLIATEIQYKKTYTESVNYLQLLYVDVHVNLSDGYKVKRMYVNNGQTGIRGGTTTKSADIRATSYYFAPNNWGSVVDDNGAGFTIVGTYIKLTLQRGKSTTEVDIYNQVYNKQVQLNDEHYWQEGIDPFDILIEGLQRGER
ncbi:MAG: RHS repeat-associated core domain-containing protein, partial [Clostridia bacterium]|nr:RHS repeat-associated core domain-containing protein [Clostridia bacterium]